MNDDDLNRTLRRADPAAHLSPLSPDRFDRLMKDTTMTETTARPKTSLRTRIALGVVGGLAAAGVATAVAFAVIPSDPTVLQNAPGGIAAKCAAPAPEFYADADLAFQATVTSIEGGTVTLKVTDRFLGDVNDTVTTTQGDGEVSDGGPLVYENGATYLIASADGTVLSCGLSGVESDELAAVYDATF